MLGEPICNPVSFRAEARFQMVCAACGKGGAFHAHHVVDVNTLRQHGIKGNKAYDTRNALRLCQAMGDVNKRCHFQHENYRRLVKVKELLDCNIEYAEEVLGEWAYEYLTCEYDNRDPDPRIEHLRPHASSV